MTQQDDITQRVLTDDEIRAVWVEHGLDDEAVEDFARAIESALLSKLRAPVADERATKALNRIERRASDDGRRRDIDDLAVVRATLASAPVAGEPVAWETDAVGPTNDPKLADVWRKMGWPVRPLYAAPQASAEYERGHADGWAAGWDQAIKQTQADKDGCTCPSGDGSLRHPCPMHPGADKDGGQWESKTPEQIAADMRAMARSEGFDWPEPDGSQQLRWRVTDDMRYAVRFAPSSAHWSERLKEFFGPDAREGIDALERQLREARAMLDRQQRAGDADKHEQMRDVLQWIVDDAASGGVAKLRPQQEKRARAALSAPQAEQGEREDG